MANNMSKWDEVIIGDHIDLISGYAFKSADFLNEQELGSLPVIKIKNVANGDVNLSDVVYHRYNASLEKFLLAKGDVLIAMTGNHPHAQTQVVGDVSRYKLVVNALLNQRVGKLITKDETSLDYIYYLFKCEDVKNYLANHSSGSANQANISKGDILGLILNIPSPVEQTAIASVLCSLDEKIDLLYHQNLTLEKLAETLFRNWFIEEVKDEWAISSLSEMANFLNGLACQKFPPKNEIDKLPVLKIRELTNGISENSDWASTDIQPEYIVRNGDVIFAWSASLMVKIWDGQDCILNQHLFKVTSEDYPKWFYYLWCKYHLAEFISIAASHATTMGHIKRGDLDEAKVLMPSPEELAAMTEQAEPLIQKIIANNIQINTLLKLRDSLLPKLMCGEVTVELEN
jgi:type I restriction enzyme S subunit